MKEGGAIILAVVLLLPPAPCSGDAVFRCERETTLFGIQKRTQLEISGSVIFTTLFLNSSTQILELRRTVS